MYTLIAHVRPSWYEPGMHISAPLTPMLKQYQDIKIQYPDCFLFYRMGDFYEMFFEDAVLAAPLLEVQLTSRDKSASNPIPMCGVPHHAVTHYIEKLIQHGKKVALCEQLEDPSVAKGIVKRDVIRVITPALVADPELVSETITNILSCVKKKEDGFEVSLLDLLASRVRTGLVETEAALIDVFYQHQPKEILISIGEETAAWAKKLRKHFPTMLFSIRDFKSAGTTESLGRYVQETQKTSALAEIFKNPEPLTSSKHMRLDATTLNSLEVIKGNGLGTDTPSLFSTLDQTVTPMGKRLLKEWLLYPLYDLDAIQARLDSVDLFWVKPALLEGVRSHLRALRDLERLATKCSLGLAMPRDLVVIRESLKQVPVIKATLGKPKPSRLMQIAQALDPLKSVVKLLSDALEDEPSSTLREGGIFKASYHEEVASLRKITTDAKAFVEAMEQRERKRTGITSLKIKYSRVFGYTIEVTQAGLSKVPKHYQRKQTIANGERFVTEELKKFEEKVETAETRLKALEETLFLELRKKVVEVSSKILLNARLLAELDIYQSFALTAVQKNYVKPEMSVGWDLKIEGGRHPVVETLLPLGEFIPNDIQFCDKESRTWLITGPNMSGKSTIMRQVALITLMSHVGSFVPASLARISLTDSIFTRIGSADDLAHGRSTFMVEMTEMARILNSATERSLILIDEVGRGTSTYDGLSLAMSLIEYIHENQRAKTFFATHFHELTILEKKFPTLKNANVLVRNWNNEIVFLHKLVPGICRKSYGVEVAKLAGLPSKVLLRAEEILKHLESQSEKGVSKRCEALHESTLQMEIFPNEKPLENRSSFDA